MTLFQWLTLGLAIVSSLVIPFIFHIYGKIEKINDRLQETNMTIAKECISVQHLQDLKNDIEKHLVRFEKFLELKLGSGREYE